jgi:hypothetical protein
MKPRPLHAIGSAKTFNSARYGKTDIEAKSPEGVPDDIEAA